MKIKSWEIEIIDFLLGASLTDEVLKIKPAQKLAGQHSWYKAFVSIRNYNINVGLDTVNCAKEITTANQGANILAYFYILPIQRDYYGNKIFKLHIVPCKMTAYFEPLFLSLITGWRGTDDLYANVRWRSALMTATRHLEKILPPLANLPAVPSMLPPGPISTWTTDF